MDYSSSEAGKKFNQFLAIALALATTVVLSGLAALMPIISANAAGLQEGSLIKTADAPEVFIINDKAHGSFSGWKRHIFNPDVFNMYGHLTWDGIQIVPQSTLDMYDTSDLYKSDVDVRVYSLEEQGATAIKHHIENEAAFAAQGYSWDQIFIVNDREVNYYATGDVITAGGTTTPPVTGDVSVALAADSPAAGALVAGQAVAKLAKFTFSNGSSSDIKVTGVVLNRTGISVDTTLVNVYLYDGASRLTDSASVSDTRVTFNDASGIFTIPANSSKTVTVKSDIAAGTNGQIVGVALASLTSDSTVAGSFPVAGAQHSIATATLAGVDWNTTTTPAPASIDPQNDYVMWQNTVSITTRDVTMSSFRLREIGSINYSDLGNFQLFVSGVKVGNTVASLDSDGYVLFDLSASPVELKTGSRVIKVTGDVIGGSDRNFSFSLRNTADAEMMDSELSASILATAAGGSFTVRTAGTQSVNQGTLTITKKTDSPSGDVTLDGSGVTLATYEFKAAGEKIKVENLRVAIAEDDGDTDYALRNGALFADGVQVGSSASIASDNDSPAYTEFSLGSSLIVTPGTSVMVEIRADIFDDAGTNGVTATDTIQANLVVGSNNAERLTSGGFFNSSATTGNTLTVATGAVALSEYQAYADQTIVAPQTAYKIAEFRLVSTETEAITLDTLTVALTGSSTVATDLEDIYIVYGSKTSSVKNTVAASNVWQISETLPANDGLAISVYATINTTITSGDTVITALTVAGTSVDSATAITSGSVTGQTMTAGSGSIASALSASTPVSTLLVQNTESKVASFEFTATNEKYTITDLAVKVGANAATVISSLTYKETDGTVIRTGVPLNGLVATSSGLAIVVPSNGDKTVDVYLNLASVGTGAATTSADVAVTLESFKADNTNGTETADYTDRVGNSMYVMKTLPTISNAALPSTTLVAGTKTISKFTISSDNQPIAWKKITLNVTKSGSFAIATGTTMKLYDAATNLEVAAALTTTGDLSGSGSSGTVVFVTTTEQEVSGSKTYYVKASISGSITAGDSVSVEIQRPSSFAASNTYAVVAATTASFVWSDQSLVAHSTTTTDWMNDNLLMNLPTDSQTLIQ